MQFIGSYDNWRMGEYDKLKGGRNTRMPSRGTRGMPDEGGITNREKR